MGWRSTWNEPPGGGRPGFLADRGGWFPPGVKLILLLTVGVFVVEAVKPGPLMALGAVSVRGLLRFEVWRLVMYMFLHASADHILVNMFIFWMIGSVLERQIGTRPFLLMYLAAGVVGGLFEVAFNGLMFLRYGPPAGEVFLAMPAVGASAGVMGILMAFATLNPRARFYVFGLLPVKAWAVAVIYGLFETWPIINDLVLAPMRWTDNVAHAAHVGGMALGFVWIKWGRRIAARLGRGGGAGRRVIDRSRQDEQAELDRILEKVHSHGVDSLTLREKLFLQEMSDKYRDRQ
jgi:membrane associated rhomboid family serine protease